MIVRIPRVFVGVTLAVALALGGGKPRPCIIHFQRQTIFQAYIHRSGSITLLSVAQLSNINLNGMMIQQATGLSLCLAGENSVFSAAVIEDS